MRPGLKRIIKIVVYLVLLSLISLLFFGYLQYRDLRKTLALKLSEKTTALIGQKVEIGDISFSPSAGINLSHIAIKNPDGFAPGNLLYIERIFLGVHYTRLIKGEFSFGDIRVYSPALTIRTDGDGRMNISEKLKDFFRRKSSLRYQIDEFTIKAGSFDFDQNRFLNAGALNIHCKDLSSETGHKSVFQGDAVYAGDNRIAVEGWAYLKDEPKKFSIIISSKNPGLSVLKEYFGRYGISAEKVKATVRFSAEGDTEQGFRLASDIGLHEAGFAFFKRDGKDVLLTMHSFFNIRDNLLSVEDLSLSAAGSTVATAKGDIRKIQGDFDYTAWLKIRRLDLAAFNFMQNTQVKGMLTSDNVRIHGNMKKPLQEITGLLQFHEGGFKSNSMDIEGVTAEMKATSEKGMTVDVKMKGKIIKAYGYILSKPSDALLSLTAYGTPGHIGFISSATLAPFGIQTKDSKQLHLDSISFAADGTVRNGTIEANSRIDARGIKYDAYQTPWLLTSSAVTWKGNLIELKKQKIEGDIFKAAVDGILVTLPPKQRAYTVNIEVKDFNASYPPKKAEIKNASLSLRLGIGPHPSGDFAFTVGEAVFNRLRAGFTKGNGRFDDKTFLLNLPQAAIAGGNAEISLRGATSSGPFPLTIALKAQDIDIGSLSEALHVNGDATYTVAGNCRNIFFEGIVGSRESVQGNAEIQSDKIAILRKDKKNIIQNASLNGRITFRGSDLEFNARTTAGKVSTTISGTATHFLNEGRSAELKIIQPQIPVVDLRETFWDIFPDSLLYAGLDGTLSSDLQISYGRGGVTVKGDLGLQDFSLKGENGEYSIGPVNGVIPVVYGKVTASPSSGPGQGQKTPAEKKEMKLPSFEQSEFSNLSRMYSGEFAGEGYRRITIGSVNYGFRFLDDIQIWIKQDGDVLNIGRFNGSIFGGKLNGTARVDLAEGLYYRAGVHLEGLSLTRLCNSIEPIKGYISGRVDGIATLKGSGPGIAQLLGKAEFWSYATRDEKTKISKEFLKKMGGPSLKAYLGDRPFDRGTMSLYLQNGFMIFDELEISHKNLIGMRDLSIKVAPFNNRIAIDHLMWSIIEAASRGKEK